MKIGTTDGVINIDGKVSRFVDECERELSTIFSGFDETALIAQAKVLNAFQKERVAIHHFAGTTGYGYGDEGREKLGAVFASVFGTEDALVTPLIMSGTHAIVLALAGLLRHGSHVVCVTGEPYDTLMTAITDAGGSLVENGVAFTTIPLNDNQIDVPECICRVHPDDAPDMLYFQRSTGYSTRPAFTVEQLRDAMRELRNSYPSSIFFVDNCYGEFVDTCEPTEVGADLIAGSLIKNPGGGLAPSGGYIAGRASLVARIASRYSAPGIGREVGSYAYGYREFFQGLFLAPHTVCQALKGVALAACIFEKLGYDVSPRFSDPRGDITQVISFNNPDALTAFVRAIQAVSPVDSFVVPHAWDMPGYADPVIMAAGTFVQGASLELTCDAPMRPPYAAYLQGSLTYEHAKLAMMTAAQNIMPQSM